MLDRWSLVIVLMAGAWTGFVHGADSITFEQHVLPILRNRCGRCHADESRKGELSLTSAAGLQKGGESGAVITPKQSDKSRLFEVIRDGEMPPDQQNPLTKEEMELLRRWIDDGARFPAESGSTAPAITQHDVIPILLLRCTACHGRQKQEANLDLRTKASMLRGGKSGPAIVPGQPAQSLLLQRIHREEMPPRPRLVEAMVKPMEPAEIEKLTEWIAKGAPEVPDEPDVAGTSADPLVRDADRQHWAFQPPKSVAVPAVQHPERVRSAIDAFVLAALESNSLSLSPEADRLTLLRRASFDLTGLPPDADEARAFLLDDDPLAYEKLIDRLLASPRYGERWGRHWLDVAGYADCEGRREQHLPRPDVWRYRDYVIRSFNSDKPYDRFLKEQLAGDELADYVHAAVITAEIEDNLVATAFLRMSPDPTWANLTGFVPDRLEVMADAIDVLGAGVMGLTLKCARCHTHKFDPIPQRDYYRLVAVFKGAYDEHDWLKPQLIGFGGALSASFGERYLPHVTTEEQQRIDAVNAAIDQQIASLKAGPQTPEVTQHLQQLTSQRKPQPRLFALWDRGEPSPTYVYRRGDYQHSGTHVVPGPPAVLMRDGKPFRITPPYEGAVSTGRRLAFADWLTQPDHPLTARVLVNRVWKHHFGQGLVRSVGNFGVTGDKPSHPELLDWLATEFVRHRWSVKDLHRIMMTSSTYRQSSQRRDPDVDPDLRLLSRMPMRRMEAEVVLDSLRYIAEELNDTAYGPPVAVTVRPDGLVLAGHRRSIYAQQLRKHPASLLESFDLPAMNPNCLSRAESLVAPQALHLMNDASIRSLANHFAARVIRESPADPMDRIARVHWIALSRSPDADELAACRAAYDQLVSEWTARGEPAPDQRALATIGHTLMNSAAFLYLD